MNGDRDFKVALAASLKTLQADISWTRNENLTDTAPRGLSCQINHLDMFDMLQLRKEITNEQVQTNKQTKKVALGASALAGASAFVAPAYSMMFNILVCSYISKLCYIMI